MKKRILSILLALALLCALLPAAALPAHAQTYSGTCGSNLTWTYDSSTGTLNIQGSGEMKDHEFMMDAPPWYDMRNYAKKIVIGSGITSIGEAAFYDFTAVTNVTIPSTVKKIGDHAFVRCISLPGITIPSSVTSIGEGAFQACLALTAVSIPTSVTSIGEDAFLFCDSLTKFTVASGNKYYSSDSSGGLFNKNQTTLIQFPPAFKGSYTIPGTVTSIGDSAFADCAGLTGIVIPNGVKSIGTWAFSECTGLTTISIPKSVTSIGNYAFGSCTKLSKITVAADNPYYYSDSFGVLFTAGQMRLIQCPPAFKGSYTIPGTVTTIANSAFSSCSGLTAVTIPKSVTNIGEYAFSNCSGLSGVFIPASVTTIGYGAFYGYGSGFAIYGVSGSAAETYANNYSIPFVAVAAPKITTQPKNATVVAGKTATFKVVATGYVLSYQWQYKRAGASAWTDWSGKTAATLTVAAASSNNGCKYRCVVSNPLGKKTSNAATLTVTVAKPVITTKPKSVSLAVGECMTFTCAATGEGTLRYQWQYKKSGDTSWTNWSGATNTYFSVKGSNTNGGCQYRCAVKNEAGTTYSDAATLTITSAHECPGAAFTDMPAIGTIEHTAIDWAIRTGITNGTSATKFSPNMTVTRSQVVTFLWRACGSPEPKTTKNPFTDVKTTDWFCKAVLWAVEQGITNGTSATKFSPSMVCSRSQILTFLYRQQGSPAVGSVTVPYTDVQAGAFYENAMKWAYANGIDRGTTKTTFSPNVDCIRVSNVVFLYRAITGQGRLS